MITLNRVYGVIFNNIDKKYYYLSEEDYEIGSLVLVNTERGLQLVKVVQVLEKNKIQEEMEKIERLDDIIVLARENKMNVKELQFISTKKEKAANTILVKCVKNGKPGIKLRKDICVDNLGTYQHLFESEVI